MAVDSRSSAVDMIGVALQIWQERDSAQMRLLVLDMRTRGCKAVGCGPVGFDGMVVGQWSQGQG